ncbi:MAG: gas vesicle protein GvpN [Desulfotomaculaceae bacterium]
MKIEHFSPLNLNLKGFVNTPYIDDLVERALTYINADFPVNLSGPAGTGKTTMAMYLASKIGRPVVLLHGNDEITSSKLVGGNYGYRKKTKVDNYIHTVQEMEESLYYQWVEGVLAAACRNGTVLVYDEFTRSRPEVNNLLLSILEEKTLSLPGWQREDHYLRVHPEFRAVFTSNPEEYAGVHRAQVALLDRMINMEINQFDSETEITITAAKSGLDNEKSSLIVNIVRAFRNKCEVNSHVSVRSSIRIATIARSSGVEVSSADSKFCRIVNDVLMSEVMAADKGIRHQTDRMLSEILSQGGAGTEK